MIEVTAITRGLLLWQQIVLVFLFVLLFVWAVVATWAATHPAAGKNETSSENIEPQMREWLDAFGYTVTKKSGEHFVFLYEVRLPNGTPLGIARTKERAQYITLVGRIEVSQEHRELFGQLSHENQTLFIAGLRLEVAKSRIGCHIEELPFNIVTMEKLIPITNALTEAVLIDALREMNFGMIVVQDSIALRLMEAKQKQDSAKQPQ